MMHNRTNGDAGATVVGIRTDELRKRPRQQHDYARLSTIGTTCRPNEDDVRRRKAQRLAAVRSRESPEAARRRQAVDACRHHTKRKHEIAAVGSRLTMDDVSVLSNDLSNAEHDPVSLVLLAAESDGVAHPYQLIRAVNVPLTV
jgi:hypothetical protein